MNFIAWVSFFNIVVMLVSIWCLYEIKDVQATMDELFSDMMLRTHNLLDKCLELKEKKHHDQ